MYVQGKYRYLEKLFMEFIYKNQVFKNILGKLILTLKIGKAF